MAFLDEWNDIVVKPARGERGDGVTTGVVDRDGLAKALDLAKAVSAAAVAAARATGAPVVGVDLMVPSVEGPEYVIIEANEQPGLAVDAEQRTIQRFLDLLFPDTAR